MKKTVAMLCAVLILSLAACAMAQTVRFVEDSPEFNIEMELPEGTTLGNQTSQGMVSVAELRHDDHANVRVSIAPSELYDGMSLEEMSDEEVGYLMTALCAEYENPSAEMGVTPSGNEYIYICSNEATDIDSICTVYKGYFITLVQMNDDLSPLGESDYEYLLELLYNLNFIPLT